MTTAAPQPFSHFTVLFFCVVLRGWLLAHSVIFIIQANEVLSIINVELAKRKPFGWHMRLTAEANGISDVNNTQSSEQLNQCETDYAVKLSYCWPVWVSGLAQESRVLAHPTPPGELSLSAGLKQKRAGPASQRAAKCFSWYPRDFPVQNEG